MQAAPRWRGQCCVFREAAVLFRGVRVCRPGRGKRGIARRLVLPLSVGPWTIFLTPTPGLSFHFCKSKNQKPKKQLCVSSVLVCHALEMVKEGWSGGEGCVGAARRDEAATAPDWGPLAPT